MSEVIRIPRRTAAVAAAAVAALAVGTLPAQAVPAGPGGPKLGTVRQADNPRDVVRDSYIVTLKPGVKAPSAAGVRLASRYGGKISHTYQRALNGYAVKLNAVQARRLAADPAVASVAQDVKVRASATQTNPVWGLDRVDQPTLPLDGRYTSPDGGGAGATVYVIDTGIRISHKEFGGRARNGYDFVGKDKVAQDSNGHGTHVAATAVGSTYGVAKRAKVVGVRVLDAYGEGTLAQVIAGIDWVTRNAAKPAVANLSLGGGVSPELDKAVRTSIASGITYTVAAGNEGLPAETTSPGRVKQAITVGATNRWDERSYFSNWGPVVDLFAPGEGIKSASHKSDTGTVTFDGTSMAAPHVAGAAALYLAANPKATPATVEKGMVGKASTGQISGRRIGSPDRLLQVSP
ncbi:Extracellular serine proteinase precursor [Streptomyces sp. ADI96-15]|uniref:S8 family peptidase n=1 Tax=unclassified Streptomyces TaxID=2593676 RepID=UPI0003C3127E|nr:MULTISPECIES: S8 family peptidase [unclassified Streptomyces]ESP99622.1 Secreted serine protease [Streptomyces sp. GBA 94-10 4N24]RPK59308.1 Extracellular serine proteinase precursor [Streptomyces sp. ADI96-15]UZN58581.1 Secreted serine protease [Streptomyces sp. GBA 94-10 4N24]